MKAQLAEASLIDWDRPYRDREALVSEWLPTRFGKGTVTVAVKNLVSPFTGQKIEALPIRALRLRNGLFAKSLLLIADDGHCRWRYRCRLGFARKVTFARRL
jgi:hypothetical protein